MQDYELISSEIYHESQYPRWYRIAREVVGAVVVLVATAGIMWGFLWVASQQYK